MQLLLSLYLAALFVVFTPGVLVTLPKGGSKMTVLAVHALLFTVVWYFTQKTVARLSMGLEGFQDDDEEEEYMNSGNEGFQFWRGGRGAFWNIFRR